MLDSAPPGSQRVRGCLDSWFCVHRGAWCLCLCELVLWCRDGSKPLSYSPGGGSNH